MGQGEPGSTERTSNITLLTRLVIGSVLAGYDGLIKRASHSENVIDKKEQSNLVPSNTTNNFITVTRDDNGDQESKSDRIRFAVIGMIFDSQEALRKGADLIDKMSRRTASVIDRFTGPVYGSRIFSPFRNSLDKLAQRGQAEVDRWIDIGRKEEKRSRELTYTALSEQVDNSIQYLTSNSEVQELVQSQSVGLIGEIVEETRERTLSADYYIEAWARTILRRPMRSDLPEPPPELKRARFPSEGIKGRLLRNDIFRSITTSSYLGRSLCRHYQPINRFRYRYHYYLCNHLFDKLVHRYDISVAPA